MKLHQLRDVIAVAECGSLRAAARSLNIAQSAITKSVQQLERELDAELFVRHKQGVNPTVAGNAFVQRAHAALSELQRARDDIRQQSEDGTGQVELSLSTVPNMALLPIVIGPFKQRYPRVRLIVHEALGFHAAEPLMRTGRIDAYVGIRPGYKLSNEYKVEPLFRNPRVIIAGLGHPLASARSLRDLADAKWLVSSTTSAESGLLALFRKHHSKSPEYITCAGSILSQVVLLLNSDMLMIGPRQLLDLAQNKRRLVRVPVRETIEAPMMALIRRTASPLTPAAEYFCDLVRRASLHLKDDLPRR